MTFMPRINAMCAPARPPVIRLGDKGRIIVMEILTGERSHKDLKHAFDWENTPEGHKYWSTVRQRPGLSTEAQRKLEQAIGLSSSTPN